MGPAKALLAIWGRLWESSAGFPAAPGLALDRPVFWGLRAGIPLASLAPLIPEHLSTFPQNQA